ncbi:MAG: DUF3887 domain-containing protein [Halothermotrichaceae bacterium]
MRILKKVLILTLILLAIINLNAAADEFDPEKMGVNFVNYLVKGDYQAAFESFDEKMKGEMPLADLKSFWNTITSNGQLGQFEKILGSRAEKYTSEGVNYDVAFVSCKFQNFIRDFKLFINSDGQIVGLYLVPSDWEKDKSIYNPVEKIEGNKQDQSENKDIDNNPAQAEEQVKLPEYINKDKFSEEQVTIGSGKWSLPGTLTIPEGNGPFPGIVLVHGSGPNDRDETIGANKPFRDIAWGLATQGIAVLRYDKRTFHHPDKINVKEITVKEETIADAVKAVELMDGRKIIDSDHLYVLGHSLGGYLVPRIDDSSALIDGYVIMAGLARTLEDIILEQNKYLLSLDGLSEKDKEDIAQVEKIVKKVKDLTEADLKDNEMYLNLPVKYWLELKGYDPAVEAAEIDEPMLVLQGKRDIQVTMTDFKIWQEELSEKDNVQFISYEKLNHLFITGEGPGTLQEYNKKGNVEAKVIMDIADWIKKQNQ